MSSPVVSKILAKVYLQLPHVSKEDVASVSYINFKYDRLRSVVTKVCDASKKLEREGCTQDEYSKLHALARDFFPLRQRLVNKELIGRSEIDAFYKLYGTKEKFDAATGYVLVKSQEEKPSNAVYEQAAARSIRQKAEDYVFRIQEDIAKGGYPVFCTLTADAQSEWVFAKGSEELKKYRRKLERRFGKFTYCAVTERGEEGRLHLHCLFNFEELKFSDPNAFKPDGSRKEPPELRGLWPHGFDNPIAVRFSPLDAYGRSGWRWPHLQETGNPAAVAKYMADYIQKPTKETGLCRTKMSRNYGLQNLQMTVAEAMLIRLGGHENFLRKRSTVTKPHKRLLNRLAGKVLFAQAPNLLLPDPKRGSVSQAAEKLTTHKSTLRNVGDSINKAKDLSNKELNQYRKITKPLKVGRF